MVLARADPEAQTSQPLPFLALVSGLPVTQEEENRKGWAKVTGMGEEGLSEGETEIVSAVDIEGRGYDPRCV